MRSISDGAPPQVRDPAGPLAEDDAPPARDERSGTQRQIRGSSILLAGRLTSMGLNLLVQVLIVRQLAPSAFGAFAYAMSLVALGQTIATFGLDRAVARFVALYDEYDQPGKMLGTIVMVAGTIVGLGALLAAAVWLGQDLVVAHGLADGRAVSLLAVLILLAPIQALDSLAISLFAVFTRPMAIFVRRYLLAPALRLAVVALLLVRDADVTFLATGYVAASALGLLLYLPVLWRVLRRQGVLSRPSIGRFEVPVREILTFTVPLLTSDLVYAVMNVSDAVMLGWFRDTEAVGALRAIQPVAKLNLFVMSSFAVLYTPLAARLHARRDRLGLESLYWQTGMWLAVLTFPVFLAGFALARPVTVTLFGEAYAGSAIYLSLLAFGYYTQVAFGFNGLTLKACGAVRIIVVQNLAAAATNIVLNLLLIPVLGALGAATSTMVALVFHNVLKQVGLRRVTGVRGMNRPAKIVYGMVLGFALTLAALQLTLDLQLLPGLVIGAAMSLVLLLTARSQLDITGTFPELLRVPLLRLVLRPGRPGA